MAPLFQYFHICLFLSALFVSLSESETQTQLPQIIPTNQILLGRRILLVKPVDADEEDNLVMVLPKKKKVQKTNPVDQDGDDELPIKKKKKKLTSLDDEVEKETIPKKKKSSSNDEKESISLSKKKKSSSNDEEEPISLSKKKIDAKVIIKSKTTSLKNQTKLTKPTSNSSNSSTKNQTKLIKPIISSSSSKNKTKLTKPTSSTSKDVVNDPKPNLNKTKINKSNSSTTSKSLDSLKNNKTKSEKKSKNIKPIQKQKSTTLLYQDEDDDLVADFRDLPAKFQQTFVPDLQRISTTSRVYLSKASKEITKGFKPYVGTKYAASMTTAISFAFIVVPLLLVSLIFNQIKAYFSLQRLLIFIQIYLAIYFSILCISSLVTGLEPLRFFYATSRSTYVWLQLLQTLGYALYLLLLLMYLVLVFSTESGLAHKLLGLAQTLVGFAVGLHYYMTVFHRVVLRQPPKTNWKVHGIYAACFLVICLFARADRRKKAYPEEGGQEGKNS